MRGTALVRASCDARGGEPSPMATRTPQTDSWSGEFGKDYTDRNALTLPEMEALYERRYGLTRTTMNQRFLDGVPRTARILELGSNVGNQLACLQAMGFRHLYGIELQPYAVELSKSRTRGINLAEGTAYDVPYREGYFDVVFTSGLLIHLPPDQLPQALAEAHRCSRQYLWGFEYYAPTTTEVVYRGRPQLLWKADFARLYVERFPGLRLLREERFSHRDAPENVDAMFLLEKR